MTDSPDQAVTREEIDPSNLNMVNTIILWRIYDLMLLLVGAQCGQEAALNVAQAHARGSFIGPNPSFNGVNSDGPGE